MRIKNRAMIATAAIAGLVGATLAVQPATAAVPRATTANSDVGPIVDAPVSFQVQNVNHTSVACLPLPDGKTYTITGHITGPAAAVASGDAATLYLHAVTQTETYWRFTAVPGYDYSMQQAENGHVSVTIDRLGYGTSGHPPGYLSCFGSQATVAHEIISDLKDGDYSAPSMATPPKFSRMFLAGHSAGGLIGTIEDYSFHDIAGFVDFAWSDAPPTPFTAEQLGFTTTDCLLGGAPGTPGYAPFADSRLGGNQGATVLFYSASPAVRAAAPKAAPDPCGDILSFSAAIAADVVGVPTATAPVLLVFGEDDAIFPVAAAELQAARYTGSHDVTLSLLPDTGHGLNYEASHLQTVALVSQWLDARGG